MPKKVLVVLLIGMVCFLLSGCALLNIPFQMVGMAGSLLSQAMNLLGGLPMPPPGVFF